MRRREFPGYYSWHGMKARCLNKNNKAFKNYGGRGVVICDRWKISFKNFIKDMGLKPSRKHTIERINNSKGYYKDNCKWATSGEQNRNKRSNRFYSFKNETKVLTDWATHFNIGFLTLRHRLVRHDYLKIFTELDRDIDFLRKSNKSGYTGVSIDRNSKNLPWRAIISVNGKQELLGSFNCKHEAAMACDIFKEKNEIQPYKAKRHNESKRS